MTEGDTAVLEPEALEALVVALSDLGYRVLGPRLRDGAIVYDELQSADQLPIGWTDAQAAGSYRVAARADARCSATPWGRTPGSVPAAARLRLWRGTPRRDGGFDGHRAGRRRAPRYAFVGVRACELQAIGILDRVLLGGAHPDPDDARAARASSSSRSQCTQAGGNLLLHLDGGGPTAASGFDLALTEVLEGEHHCFLADAGSERGRELLRRDCRARRRRRRPIRTRRRRGAGRRREQMGRDGRRRPTCVTCSTATTRTRAGTRSRERCLTCGNCTMVCPTCFCTTVEDVTDLAGSEVERVQRWDSCFTVDYSHIHGGGGAQLRARATANG